MGSEHKSDDNGKNTKPIRLAVKIATGESNMDIAKKYHKPPKGKNNRKK